MQEPNIVLHPLQPLLKSYFDHSYSTIEIETAFGKHPYKKIINQSLELWDIPYLQDSSFVDKKTTIENKFIQGNRQFSLEDYHQTFLNYINIEHFQKNQPLLQKIIDDSEKIYLLLKPLEDLNLQYSLDITGGAVRDFVLNKPIKDLDFMISIISNEHNKEILKNLDSYTMKVFDKDICKKYLIDDDDSLMVKKQQLISMCFDSFVEKDYFFTKQQRNQPTLIKNEYGTIFSFDRLYGIIKIDQKKLNLNFPIDLLLSDFSKLAFLNSFDFDICKASFSLKNDLYNIQFPKNPLHLISRFSADNSFFADIKNKKFTLNVDNKSIKRIEHSIQKHYNRLIEKYPDYEINIIGSDVSEKNKIFAQYIYINQNNQHSFKSPITENSIKKIKI